MPGNGLVFCDKGAVGMIGAEGLGGAVDRAVDEHTHAAVKGCRVDARDAGRDADLRQICTVLEGFRADGRAAVRDLHDGHGHTLEGALPDGYGRGGQREGRRAK